MWPSERTTRAPPRPPQNAAMTKFIAIARRTEPPRYSTRNSFSRTASVTRPRVLSKAIRIATAASVATAVVRRLLAEQRRPADVEAVGAAERVQLHQEAIRHHRERQRQHREEDAAVTR